MIQEDSRKPQTRAGGLPLMLERSTVVKQVCTALYLVYSHSAESADADQFSFDPLI